MNINYMTKELVTDWKPFLIGIRSDESYFRNVLIEQAIIKGVVIVDPSGMISIQFYASSKEKYLEKMKKSGRIGFNLNNS